MKRRQRVRHTDIAYCTSYYNLNTTKTLKEQARLRGYKITRTITMSHQGDTYYKFFVEPDCKVQNKS